MQYKITVLAGDGIGPEITKEARKVLSKAAEQEGFSLEFREEHFGGAAIDAVGEPLPEKTLEACKTGDAVLMGSIGGIVGVSPWYKLPVEKRPEAGLLRLRKELGLFCNLRPAKLYSELRAASPLKEEVLGEGFEIMMIRELTGGLYFGEKSLRVEKGEEVARDELIYRAHEIERIAEIAFSLAKEGRGELVSVDKANVLESSRLWRKIFTKYGEHEQEVKLDHVLVDSMAMQLVRNPGKFSVVATENMFGDILSDEMAEITGSLGMLPSASLGENAFGLYEPSGGSAPDIAGRNIANPLAAILSAAMLLRYSLKEKEAAKKIERAVEKVLAKGYRTKDIFPKRDAEGLKLLSCSEMGDAVCAEL